MAALLPKWKKVVPSVCILKQMLFEGTAAHFNAFIDVRRTFIIIQL